MPKMIGTREKSFFCRPMNTGSICTPERMAIMAAPPLTATVPGSRTRVPSGKSSRFHPSFRLRMAVFTAPMSELPRSTGKTPIPRRMAPSTGIFSSCCLAMMRMG